MNELNGARAPLMRTVIHASENHTTRPLQNICMRETMHHESWRLQTETAALQLKTELSFIL